MRAGEQNQVEVMWLAHEIPEVFGYRWAGKYRIGYELCGW